MKQWLAQRAARFDMIQEQRKLAITENTTDLVATVDIDGFLTHLNAAGYELLGMEPGTDIRGQRLVSFYDRDSARDFVGTQIRHAIKYGASHGEVQIRDVQGHELPGSQVLIAHKDAVGNIECFSVILRDITSIREAEQERKILLEELHQTKKMNTMGRLAGGVAHDFNNLITVIMGYAELAMLNNAKGDSDENELRMILDSAQKAARLSSQLLDFSSKQMIEPQVIDLNDIIKESLQLIESLLGETVIVEWHADPDLWPVKIDQSQFEQIILNLTVNARDAMSGQGLFAIRTENVTLSRKSANKLGLAEGGDYIQLTVQDNGSGIEEKHLEHIYEPFFTTKEKGKGTGLGLSSVFGAVKQNNGLIKVDSKLDSGTRFTVFFPRVLDSVDYVVPPADQRRSDKVEPGVESILLVEDNDEVRSLLTTVLTDSGYTVMTAENGARALDVYDSHGGKFDLVVSDVVMPVMNGMELYRQLQKKNPEARVILMSGHTDQMVSVEDLDLNRVNLLSKPFPTAKFTATIREALDA
jgi:PAS domain S-box-containing protein